MNSIGDKNNPGHGFAGPIQHPVLARRKSLQLGSGSAERSVLCVQYPLQGPAAVKALRTAVSFLAPAYRGYVDPWDDGFALVSFARLQAGLRMALALQRGVLRNRLCMGLLRGCCNVERAHAKGSQLVVLPGRQRALAMELARRAVPGTVQVSPDLYDVLGECIPEDLGSCVARAEFEGGTPKDAVLALAAGRP